MTHHSESIDEQAIQALYAALHDGWNARDAAGMAALFADDADVIGFDGGAMAGKTGIETELSRIFREHPTTGIFVGIIEETRFLTPDTMLLRAAAVTAPRDGGDINADTACIQTIVASKQDDAWKIELLQTTPAQWHDDPEGREELLEELRAARNMTE
jgi:uncharacterized protein (TIGR02246 family)